MPNGISHSCQLKMSILNFRGVSLYFFQILLELFNILLANSEDPDQTPHYAVSDMGLHCLPMSHKKDARHIWVKCMKNLFEPYY